MWVKIVGIGISTSVLWTIKYRFLLISTSKNYLLVLSGIYMVQIQVSSQVCSSDGQIVLI